MIGNIDVGKSSFLYKILWPGIEKPASKLCPEIVFAITYLVYKEVGHRWKDNKAKDCIWTNNNQWDIRGSPDSSSAGIRCKGTIQLNAIDSNGLILMYDVTNRDSFRDTVYYWTREMERYVPENMVKILIGNKCEEEKRRQVIYEEGEELASMYDYSFFEISATTGHNVDKIFEHLIKKILDLTALKTGNIKQFNNKTLMSIERKTYKRVIKNYIETITANTKEKKTSICNFQ